MEKVPRAQEVGAMGAMEVSAPPPTCHPSEVTHNEIVVVLASSHWGRTEI